MNHKNMSATAGLKLVIGVGRFVGPRTIEVLNENEVARVFEAEKIFVNTGTRPRTCTIAGLKKVVVFNSETIQRISELPRHLIVVGGSYVGLEFAQMFRHLGSEVTVLQLGPQLLKREEEDVANALENILREENIEVRLNCSVEKF